MNSNSSSRIQHNNELYNKVVAGDENAYYQIFEMHWERLYSISFKIIEEKEAAKDVVQDIFLKLWENRASKSIDNLEHYLARAAKFASLNNLRNNHFKHATEIDNSIRAVETENNLEYKELEDQVELAISNLPLKCQEVFRLSRQQGLSNDEIAIKLDLSKRTVETHISNALKQLRKTLPKELIMGLIIGLLS